MNRRFLAGLLMGALAGAALALLMLPDPGARLRSLAARLRATPSVSSVLERSRQRCEGARSAVRGRYAAALDEGRRAAEEARQALWAQYGAARKKPARPA